MAGKKKHEVHEEHENHERWLVSYADFITLLFAFFVVMYAVSRVDNSRIVQAQSALRFALHFEGTGGVTALPLFQGPPSEGGCPVNTAEGSKRSAAPTLAVEMLKRRIERRIGSFLREQNQRRTVIVLAEGRRITVRMSAGAFFDSSDAELRPDALAVLDAAGDELAAIGHPVRVEAHTDDRPVGGTRFRSNWALSSSRAATVVEYLEGTGKLPRERLSAAGLADTHPVAPNDTEEGREANRRVDLVVEVGDAPGTASR